MPPKKQITDAQIIEAAFSMVREEGIKALSVRNLARKLSCSTQPIYLSFQDMEALKNALGKKAIQQMEVFIQENGKEHADSLLANILGYVQFACAEKNLYQLIYSSNVMTTEQTAKLVSAANEIGMHMMIYANGLIMMNSVGTLDLSWKQLEGMILKAYRAFESGHS